MRVSENFGESFRRNGKEAGFSGRRFANIGWTEFSAHCVENKTPSMANMLAY